MAAPVLVSGGTKSDLHIRPGRMLAMDELDAARLRFPVGEEIVAPVSRVPWGPGLTGIFVALADGMEGSVDVGSLPYEAAAWPTVGTELRLQVLQHRVGQVRLWPVDARWRNDRERTPSDAWDRAKASYAVGDHVTAVVTQIFTANRECTVEFDDQVATVEWSGNAPVAGEAEAFEATRLVDGTRRVLLRRLS